MVSGTATDTILRTLKFPVILALAAAGWSAYAADVDVSKLPPPASKRGVTYEKDIRPLFAASCFRCHRGERPRGGLGLDSLEAVLKGGKDGKVVIVGKSEKSPLVIAVAQIDDKTAMPPKRRPGPPRGGGGPNAAGGPGPGAGAPPGGPDSPPPGAPPAGGNPPGPGRGGFGPPPKPLTAEEVGLVRAWIDQGAK